MKKLAFNTGIPMPVTTTETCKKHKNVFMQEIHLPSGEITTVCPQCVNEDIEKKDREMVESRLRKIQEVETIGLFERESDLNEELLGATFSNFETENISEKKMKAFGEQIASYYENGGNGNTIFLGSSGVGKSHIAISILKQLNKFHKDFRIEKSVLFISVESLMSRIKDSFKNKESRYTEDNMFRLLTSVDYLVLDDLGTESKMSKKADDANNWVQQFLFKVLDHRNITIITSNLSENEMRGLYNSKLVSRIFKGVGKKLFEVPSNVQSKRRAEFKETIPFEFEFEEQEENVSNENIEPIPVVIPVSVDSEDKLSRLLVGDKSLPVLKEEDKTSDTGTIIVEEEPTQSTEEIPDEWKQREGETDEEWVARLEKLNEEMEKQKQRELIKEGEIPDEWQQQEGETDEEWVARLEKLEKELGLV